jgi:multiple sugar transport system ATP-binding protein
MASIALNRVSKVYPNAQAAVRDLTLEIADGELLVLVGPSGSGKSTVLRLIAGLETPTSGRILIGDRDVTSVAPQARDLAMVFQSYALYPHKSVRENLAFGLRVRRVEAARIDARVRATAATLGLEALLDRKPAQLSGGQRQRVALGRAMVREPTAFLLDEPLSNLDPILRAGTRAELALLHRRLAATMVYVTHDQEEAMTLGTRIAVMRDGIVEQVGAPLDVFQRPANTFVARFVGSPPMNLWRCTCRRLSDGMRAVSPAFSIDLKGIGGAAADGCALRLGVRPHDIALVSIGEGDGAGRVALVEPLGPATLLHLQVDGLPDELARVIVPAETRLDVEDRTGFRVRRDRLHLFDDDAGIRLTYADLADA